MRLSGWRKTAPTNESMGDDVVAMLKPVLVDLGAGPDPNCWVVWGDDPRLRYSVLVPTLAGMVFASVRTSGPEGGPRATAKLVRWSKLAVSDLSLESSGGHRIVAVQVESLVLKGIDDEADRICEFVRGLIAETDDRHAPPTPIAVAQGAPAGRGVAVLPEAAAQPTAALKVAPKAALKVAPKAAPRARVASKPATAAAPRAKAAPKSAAATKTAGARKRTAEPDPADIAMDVFAAASTLVPQPAAAAPVAEHEPQPASESKAAPKGGPAPATSGPAATDPAGVPALGPGPVTTPAAGKLAPPAGAPAEGDRSGWIAPHPISAATHKPPKQRPWRP